MHVAGKIIAVTGGGDGIGRALCERFQTQGAKAIAVIDIDLTKARQVATRVGGLALQADVGREEDMIRVIEETQDRLGAIDLFCSNAGILRPDPARDSCVSSPNEDWQANWDVNLMSHVYAARALLPKMIARGEGYFLITVSAAGILNQIGAAAYSATKHAALGFAESLAITHGGQGITVSALCPQVVDTPMAQSIGEGAAAVGRVLTAEAVADEVIRGLEAETFLILPHEETRTYMERKASDPDRWLAGMQRMRHEILNGS